MQGQPVPLAGLYIYLPNNLPMASACARATDNLRGLMRSAKGRIRLGIKINPKRSMPRLLAQFIRAYFLLSFFIFVIPAQAQTPQAFRGWPVHSELSDPATQRKVEALLKLMTLEEKVGQLVDYSSGARTGPGTGRTGYPDMIAKGQVGSLFNLENAKAANELQRIAVEKSRLHIPILFGLDVIHGYRTTFPVPLGLASTWDPEVVEKAARVAAQEASAAGVRWAFSPMVDIARDARWGRMIEGAGEDPFLVGEMARAYVRGYQGKSLGAPESIVA